MAANGELDLAALTAIDVHVHVESDGHGHCALDDELMDASAAYFRSSENRTPTVADIAAHYRARKIAAVVFTVDAAGATGHPALSSEQIADEAAAHADVLIPFGSVDPTSGDDAVRRARSLVTEHGVRGFKFHPSLQGFEPNDTAYYPLYETLQELGVPALFHTGQTGIGAGLPGGRGIKLRYSDADAARRRRGRLPGPDDHHGAPLGALAGRGDLHRHAQGERLHRPVGLVAEVLPAAAGPRRRRRCSSARCCSAPTSRSSRPTAGCATSRRSTSSPRCAR